MNIYEYFEYDIRRFIQNRYKVNIYLNDGTILYLNGFMDTGNNLIEPYTNKKVKQKFYCFTYYLFIIFLHALYHILNLYNYQLYLLYMPNT